MNVTDRAAEIFLPATSRKSTTPIQVIEPDTKRGAIQGLSTQQSAWLKRQGWEAKSGKTTLVAGPDGQLEQVLFVVGIDANPFAPFQIGSLYKQLPEGDYHLETSVGTDDSLAHLALALAAYRFDRYRSKPDQKSISIKLPASVDASFLQSATNAVGFGRDMINTPANDFGPDELEAAARIIAKRNKAKFSVITGDDLLKKDFPLIHAVGRASTRAPRLIDMSWGKKSDPAIVVVGKGVVFDTGGLNIKPGNSMTLMKKDMAGAASSLTLAEMVMNAGLPINLRVLIPVAENSISGDAFRPGDILPSRDGMSVEIGNTDAEGRLILADALSLADESKPELIVSFATLTGAARVAMGPDLSPLYSTDDDWARDVVGHSMKVCDPVWPLPFWQPYDSMMKSDLADLNHITGTPFAGSITAALFLKRFVRNAGAYMHLDIYGWVPSAKPARPKGGEPHAARALFAALQDRYGK